jgi:hypothetical protein
VFASLPGNVVSMKFPKKNFNYKAGQYIFICVPEISYFQFHPFSISSSPDQDYVSLHIRVLGDWTKKLYDVTHSDPKPRKYRVLMEGPYGEPSVDIEGPRYKMFLLLSGGIGITPMQSICNDLISQEERGRELKKVWFVWSCRDSALLNSVYDDGPALAHHDVAHPTRHPTAFTPDVLKRTGTSIARIGGADEPDHTGHVEGEGKADTTNVTLQHADDDSDFLHTEFYLTRVRNTAEFANANVKPELQECLRMGRPRLPLIFAKMKEIAKRNGCSEVAVLSCGPTPLVDQARKLCWSESGGGVSFDFHSETFAF